MFILIMIPIFHKYINALFYLNTIITLYKLMHMLYNMKLLIYTCVVIIDTLNLFIVNYSDFSDNKHH